MEGKRKWGERRRKGRETHGGGETGRYVRKENMKRNEYVENIREGNKKIRQGRKLMKRVKKEEKATDKIKIR